MVHIRDGVLTVRCVVWTALSLHRASDRRRLAQSPGMKAFPSKRIVFLIPSLPAPATTNLAISSKVEERLVTSAGYTSIELPSDERTILSTLVDSNPNDLT